MKVTLSLCLFTLCALQSRAQAGATLADNVVASSHPKLKSLLSQPNGLAEAANQAGHLIVETYNAPPKNLTISGLSAASDVIVLGKVLARTAAVDAATNLVTTRVQIQVDEQFKGSAPREAYVNVPGGLVVFAPNAIADVRSFETKGLGKGTEVLLFLSRTSDADTFAPANGIESMFWVSLADGMVTSMTRYDTHTHLVQSTSQTLASLRPQLSAVSVAPSR